MTVDGGEPKASFSIATTLKCGRRCYSFPWIAPLYPWSIPYNAEWTQVSRTIGEHSNHHAITNGLGDRGSIPGWVIPKTQKWYLMPHCWTVSIIKSSLRVTFDHSCQLRKIKDAVIITITPCEFFYTSVNWWVFMGVWVTFKIALNKSWRQHPTRHQLYGHLPLITKTIQVRRTRHAGHCWRSRDELIRDVLLWTPTHGRSKAGRPAWTYIQQLCEDTECCPEDLPRAMNDREEWRERVKDIRATSAIWWWWWWVTSCLLKSSGLFSVFCPILIMLL